MDDLDQLYANCKIAARSQTQPYKRTAVSDNCLYLVATATDLSDRERVEMAEGFYARVMKDEELV